MKEVELLLNQRWVQRRQNPDLYHRLRDQFAQYQEFFKEKLGYRLIVNSLLVKAEKIPGECHPWMGIQSFDSSMDYVILCLLLMFLEEKQPEEQFILEQVTDYVQSNYPREAGGASPISGSDAPDRTPSVPAAQGAIDWTLFAHRRSLIRVLRFCAEEGMILVNDGDERVFEGNREAAVLYENTGASKYFMRHFTFDIAGLKDTEDFLQMEWQGSDTDRGVMRRHRVYRRLAMSPVVYQTGSEDQDYLYIKNQRSVLANDFEKFLPARLHIHKNGAMLLLEEGATLTDSYPGGGNISDISLHLSTVIRQYIQEQNISFDANDAWTLSQTLWDRLLSDCICLYSNGWNKQYRQQIPFIKLKTELLEYMEGFGLLRQKSRTKEIVILPALFKMMGAYPADYKGELKWSE